jgi:hypothetical protein
MVEGFVVVKALNGLGNILGHRQRHSVLIVVELDEESEILVSFPADLDVIQLLQRINKMICVVKTMVFDSKVIYYQTEPSAALCMVK